MSNKLELTWVGKGEQHTIEPRLLIENPSLSFSSYPNGLLSNCTYDNLLIHGDNLLALRALENAYSNKIKCIFIDPPFNTGAAFEHYDDNKEHSIWLDLMYRRITSFYKLLKDDGVLLIEIDDNEMPYLRVILDEVFGRSKFVAQINVKSNNLSGNKTAHKEKTILRNKDNIIVYKKSDNLTVYPQYVERTRWDTHYNLFITFKNGEILEIRKLKDVLVEKGLIEPKETVKEDILKNKEFYDFILKYRNNISRYVNSMPAEIKARSKANPDEIIKYLDENGQTRFAHNGNRISFLSSSIMSIDGKEKFVQLLGDLWVDIDFQNTQNEGGVSFPNSKKPEALIRRVLEMLTLPGDLVLDSFLGSGTTCAVAHKMGRKWIGIEMGDHAYTHCKVRLDRVIKNEDKNGITSLVNWTGGGGYKFYELAPTLINKDELEEPIINKVYNPDMLAAAVALHEGFNYQPDSSLFWKQSKSNEASYLFVTTKHVDINLLRTIKNTMADDEFLVIACKSFDNECKEFSKQIVIKKIPQMLLGKCEYDKNDYSLNIINPPIYDEEEEEDE